MNESSAGLFLAIVIAAAAAQTVRNAVQRSVTRTAGVLPATWIRFAFALPFALAALAITAVAIGRPLPAPGAAFFLWITLGAVTQVLATALFVAAMAQRSFVVAVVFTKTEVLQVGLFSVVLLGESLSVPVMAAMLMGTVGVLLLSGKSPAQDSGDASWISRGAVLGLASGACLAICAVAYRGAVSSLPPELPWVRAVYGLTWAQGIQTLLLGAWLLARDRVGLGKVITEWRVSLLAGGSGALASMGWFTGFAMRSAVDVRVVGLIEVLFSYVVSRRFFREPVSRAEIAGMSLLLAGVVLVSLA